MDLEFFRYVAVDYGVLIVLISCIIINIILYIQLRECRKHNPRIEHSLEDVQLIVTKLSDRLVAINELIQQNTPRVDKLRLEFRQLSTLITILLSNNNINMSNIEQVHSSHDIEEERL